MKRLWMSKDKLRFGIDGIFSISFYGNGITISIAYLGTSLKKYDISFGWKPFFYQKINYGISGWGLNK